LYPDSGVELNEFVGRNYDAIMNIGSIGFYNGFIKKAIADMGIQTGDHILDLGCGTGRNAGHMSNYLDVHGHITGLDILEYMEKQFSRKFKNDQRINFINQRIDVPFNLQKRFDKVFISFVIHGFPHEIRSIVIQNVINHLKPGGSFHILDFAEFDMDKMPSLHRFVFKNIECKYAFDFIKRDWKEILSRYGLDNISEHYYFMNYIRLLSTKKMTDTIKNPLLIAVPTNDGKTIFPKMLGMAKYFFIYKSTFGMPIEFVEKRPNPYETTMQNLKTLDVYKVISDCDIIVAAFIGKKGKERLKEKGVKLLFKKGAIQDAQKNDFLNG